MMDSAFVKVEINGVSTSLANHLQTRYVMTRFNIDKDTWPPQQSKHFTTLAFIYHKNERTQREVITIAKASQSGNIDDIMQAAGSHENNTTSEDYDLEGSSATTDISELLAPLDHSDGNQPQTMLIEGAPGIGKSFLLKHIAYLWAKKQVLSSSKLLFLLCLRDPTVQKISSVNDLVNYFCKQEKADSNLDHNYAAYLHKTGGKNVTILLDGLDEFPEELHDNSFIVDILEHRVLSSCNVIVSSRPHASAHLHDNVMLRVDILGFTEEDRECFIKQSFNGRPESAKTLLAYLQDHPTINSLCFVPFIMTVLVFLYKHEVVLFDSVSELYMQFVCLTIRRHLTKLGLFPNEDISDLNKLPSCCSDVVKNLSKLSLKALSENQLIFSLNEIKMACSEIENVPGALNGFGLLQAVEHFSATCTTKSFNFIHFSIQEFLAAHCVANLPPEEEVQVLKENFWSKLHYNMFSMYIDLTRGQQSSFRQFLADGNSQIGIAEEFLKEQTKCFYLYKCFYEAGDKEMCKHICEATTFSERIINLRGISLLPNDVISLGFFLAKSHVKQWKD
ncbi:NACHT, LRR and PYD domains-containing protein 10-like isoform X2 [Dysidea avara]